MPSNTSIAKKRQKLQWTTADSRVAQKQGWDLFDCDIGRFEIQGLTHDDDIDYENDFEGKDDEACAFVIRRALEGSKLHVKALIICMLLDPFSMGWVMSNMVEYFLPTGWDGEFHGLYSALVHQSIPPDELVKLAVDRNLRIQAGESIFEMKS